MSEQTEVAPELTEEPKKIRNHSIFGHFCNNPPHCCEEDEKLCAKIVADHQLKQKPA